MECFASFQYAYFKTSSDDSWNSDHSQGQRDGCCMMSALCIPATIKISQYNISKIFQYFHSLMLPVRAQNPSEQYTIG